MKQLKRKIPTLVALVLIFTLGLAGCFKSDTQANSNTLGDGVNEGKLNIVTTTTMLADLAGIIGGDNVNVTGLMGPGIDPHLYQASAGDVTKMQNADVIVYNGLHLEGKMGEVFASLEGQGKTVICIENGLDPSRLLAGEDDSTVHDPHIWFDAHHWMDATRYMAQELAHVDMDNGDVYMSNMESYLIDLEELDSYIKNRVEELPEQQRVLVTAHDAFRYFGQAYGFTVKGLQGISTDAEAGTADVSDLATFIAENQIKAIFIESSVPPKNIEALQAAVQAQGFDVQIGGELYSDSLGDEETGHDTYITTCKANIDTIVDALK